MKKFLKRNILLKEENVTQNIQTAVNNAKKNSSGKDTESMGSFSDSAGDNKPTVTFDANSPSVTSQIRDFANRNVSTSSMNGATIKVQDTNNPNVTESVTFTKKELSNWLRLL